MASFHLLSTNYSNMYAYILFESAPSYCAFSSIHGLKEILIGVTCLLHRRFFDPPLPARLSIRFLGYEASARGLSSWAYEKTAVKRPDVHTAQALNSGATNTTI